MDLSSLLPALVAGLIVTTTAFTGLIATLPKLKPIVEKNLPLLFSFSVGVFLIVGAELAEEVFQDGLDLSLLGVFVLGSLATLSLSFLPSAKKDQENDHGAERSTGSAKRVLFSNGLHALGDGVLLGTTFMASVPLGIIMTIGVFIHELLHETSKYFLLRQSGFDTKKAIQTGIVASSFVLVGIVLSSIAAGWEDVLLSFAAGALLILVFNDLIPSIIKNANKEKKWPQHILIFLLGALLMYLLSSLIHH